MSQWLILCQICNALVIDRTRMKHNRCRTGLPMVFGFYCRTIKRELNRIILIIVTSTTTRRRRRAAAQETMNDYKMTNRQREKEKEKCEPAFQSFLIFVFLQLNRSSRSTVYVSTFSSFEKFMKWDGR